MKYTIKDLSEGKCAIKNDGTLEELKEVLTKAFPKDITPPQGSSDYYYGKEGVWDSTDFTNLPTQSIKDFLIPEFKRGDVVEVSNDGTRWVKRIYLSSIEGYREPHILVSSQTEDNFKNGEHFTIVFSQYIRPVQEEIVELTFEDITNGKGVGVPPHLIRIKKLWSSMKD